MLSFVRAVFSAALIAFALVPAAGADKAFQRSDLDDAAIKLEAQIKHDAGTVTKSLASLRQQADAAFQKRDFRTGMLVLGQMVTAAPNDAASWLRLARTVRQIGPRDAREKALLLDRASTAAYIAYQRASDRGVEAGSLALLGQTLADRQLWRPALDTMRLSLALRETADLRGQYEKLRVAHGFRLLGLFRRLRRRLAARLLPVLGRAAAAHRLLALRGSRGAGEACGLGERQTAVRGRLEARRALPSYATRRAALDGA